MTPEIWQHLIYHPEASVVEKILRTVLVYLFLIIGLRLAGKRELATLNPFDLVVLLTLSNTLQNAIIGNDNSVLGGIISASTLLVMNYLIVDLVYRNRGLSQLIEGGPDVLIKGGKLQRGRLAAERISEQELEAAARRQGFATLKEVDQAILYPGGTFCFIGKVPRAEAAHYHQIMAQLDRITAGLETLQSPPA
jgi:uncharacterized membrane protein YcaP (DUF421 family)